MRYVTVVSLAVVLSTVAAPASSQAPDSLSFQGFVTTPGGDPINSAGTAITFKLYEGPTEIWSETQPSVVVANGLFNVLLGSVIPLDTVRFNRPLELGIKVGGDAEIVPRTPLAAAAYAKALPGMFTFYHDDGFNAGYNVVGGAANNGLGEGVLGATIGGGGGYTASASVPNIVLMNWGTIGGGYENTVDGNAGVISGGYENTVDGFVGTVGGGNGNNASTAGTVGGGLDNMAGFRAAVGGGIINKATGDDSAISGGVSNEATGVGSAIPGGSGNRASGRNSLAAGSGANALHDRTFVWNGFTTFNDSLASTGPDQFLIGADGGVGIGTNAPASGSFLDVAGPIHAGGSTLMFRGTSASGSSNLDDGVRLRYDGSFGGGSSDYLLIEKTDGAQNAPDGGIAFVNTGADGVVETALRIYGSGSVEIPGNLTKGSGSFKIDHPLDPTNKFLYHSFVESPDMKNVYDGVVALDENGEAEVDLPTYFEALNRDFRYQLTAIGAPGPDLFIAREIDDNRFRIAGGSPGMKVSWQVTGSRKDPFAAQNPIEVEVDKSPAERGTYLHPRAFEASH